MAWESVMLHGEGAGETVSDEDLCETATFRVAVGAFGTKRTDRETHDAFVDRLMRSRAVPTYERAREVAHATATRAERRR